MYFFKSSGRFPQGELLSAEILINIKPNQVRVAYVENRELVDLKVECQASPALVGSIYRGKVMRVLPGMQAAFVDIGLERATFLYVGDVCTNQHPSQEGELVLSGMDEGEKKRKTRIQDLLTEGQAILVQVAKDPLGGKGARVTTCISLPGRHVVYMPTANQLGISRRIENEAERDRLRAIIEQIKPKGGVIVRTAGDGASEESLTSDLEYLGRLWKEVKKNYQKRPAQGLIYSEVDMELRALRDMLSEQVEKVVVDNEEAFQKVGRFIKQFMPQFKNKVELYQGQPPLFDLYEIDLEISRSLGRKIWLKSGGYIVIEEVEALVVIDVNTGRFVGKKGLEETLLKTNMEAAKEIAHQLRIRNCGGIIIIDFIDMEKLVHREKLMLFLQEQLKKDRAHTTVSTISELGLVEMTRKRIRPSLVSTLCQPCPYCDGNGYIKRRVTIANEIFSALEKEDRHPGGKGTTVVHCHRDIADWVSRKEQKTLEFIEKKLGHPIAFKLEPTYHLEQYEVKTV